MRKATAIILGIGAIVIFSDVAEARRLSFSLGRSVSVSKPVVPVSKPVAATAGATSNRGGTFVFISTNRSSNNENRPMAAAPRTPVPESQQPAHEFAAALDQMSPVATKPVEPVIEQQPEPPVMQTTPVFVSMASPPKPVERTMASAQPVRTVYCAVQAKGGCAPF